MKNILFVDDEPHYLASVKRLMRKHRDEWNFFFSESVKDALETIVSSSIDVIISDFQMPEKTGFDLLEILQSDESTHSIPFIMVTGNSEKDLKMKALENGATDLLNKPVSYGDLIARITNALKLKAYQDELKQQNEILEIKVKERTAALEFLHHDLIWRMAKIGEMRDEETGNHVVRVAHYSKLIAEAIGLKQNDAELIFLTSPLHDLGKIGTPDNILLKKGKLDEDDWSVMTQHCAVGASILLENPKMMRSFNTTKEFSDLTDLMNDNLKKTAAEIALSHHEKWDGSGYPKGLRGDKIPLFGRIVAIADVYDALRSSRPYKQAFSREKSWKIIQEGVGNHFDPEIIHKINDHQHLFESIRAKYND